MITGRITEDLEPLLNDVYLRAKDGSFLEVKTVLDTGFNSTFCFPRYLLERLKLEYFGEGIFILADGSPIDETIYLGEVIVDNQPFVVEMTMTESDTALMGMEMLLEHEAIFNLRNMTVTVI